MEAAKQHRRDRRTSGGHRTEMASGSAFQYSTLATLVPSPLCSFLLFSLQFILRRIFLTHRLYLLYPFIFHPSLLASLVRPRFNLHKCFYISSIPLFEIPPPPSPHPVRHSARNLLSRRPFLFYSCFCPLHSASSSTSYSLRQLPPLLRTAFSPLPFLSTLPSSTLAASSFGLSVLLFRSRIPDFPVVPKTTTTVTILRTTMRTPIHEDFDDTHLIFNFILLIWHVCFFFFFYLLSRLRASFDFDQFTNSIENAQWYWKREFLDTF